MKILGFIPARSGSKGVPHKNIKTIRNVPLLAFSVYTALDCKRKGLFSEVLVSTDLKDYLKDIELTGYRTDYLRPTKYSEDNSPTIDAIIHALEWLKKRGKFFEAVMTLQPTAPFRTPEHIENAINLLVGHSESTCVAGVVKLGDSHPARIKKIINGLWLEDFCDNVREPEPSRRQDFTPPAYLRNGTIYLSRISTIKMGLIRGQRVIGMEMPEANSVNVDNHKDFLIAKSALSYPPYKEYLSYFYPLIETFKRT